MSFQLLAKCCEWWSRIESTGRLLQS